MNAVLIARLIFVGYLALVGFCIYRAVNGRPRLYWVAAGLLYIMSTLFAWSIGGFTVVTVFVLVGLAIVHVVKKTPRPQELAIGATIGLIVWVTWLLLGDITWVFLPAGILLGG
ncbi:MAG: hypothetical protein WEE89_12295 [Gemmatimonadota bacterium]